MVNTDELLVCITGAALGAVSGGGIALTISALVPEVLIAVPGAAIAGAIIGCPVLLDLKK